MARDVVFTFFATPDKDAATMEPVSLFNNPPLVYPVPTSGASGGHPTWALKREGGRALPALLRAAQAKAGQPIGRVAVVGFSAGRTGAQQLITNAADRAAIDSVIDLDGLHLMKGPNGGPIEQALTPWVEYGRQCFNASHLLVLLHTAIVPGNHNVIFSTTESNQFLFDRLNPILNVPGGQQQPWQAENLSKGPPPPAIVINNPIWGANGKVAKYEKVTFAEMPPFDVRAAANYFTIGMPGQRPADHIFAANWGQRAIWQTFLAPRWNMLEGVVASFNGSEVFQQTTRVAAGDFTELPAWGDWIDVPGSQDFAENEDEPTGGGEVAPAEDDGGIVRPLGWLAAGALATYAAWRVWGKG